MSIWVSFITMISSIVFCILFISEKRRFHNDMSDIIEFLQNVLDGGRNIECCYDDIEKTRIFFLLKKIEINKQLSEENALHEKEGIKFSISNLSHQLKTPLSNVKLYENLLEDKTLTPEKRIIFQEKMCKQIEKIEWIIDSIIKCTRLEEGAIDFESTMLPIRQTITRAIDTVALKAEKRNIEIISNCEFDNILLYHNIKWTIEVFVNLFENAIKYSPENSVIELEMEKLDIYTKISVKDNGIGIKEKEYSKIFQRFYRSKDVENEEGSGIGLYLCRLILEKEMGNIVVKSKYGEGSVFQIYLLNSVP